MENKKKLSFVTGAALAIFSAGVVHAGDLTKTLDLTGSVLVADGDKGCSAKEGDKGCGGDKKEDKKDGEKTCHGHMKGKKGKMDKEKGDHKDKEDHKVEDDTKKSD